MYFDGSLMKTGAGAGLLFISPLEVHMRYIIRLYFAASNNVAEYEALVNGLQIAIELGVRRLDVLGDSQLVINQVMKESNCHDLKMEVYYKLVRRLEDKFDGLELNHIARKFNEVADELAKMASARASVLSAGSSPRTRRSRKGTRQSVPWSASGGSESIAMDSGSGGEVSVAKGASGPVVGSTDGPSTVAKS